jgi:hypothetical protein
VEYAPQKLPYNFRSSFLSSMLKQLIADALLNLITEFWKLKLKAKRRMIFLEKQEK